MTPILKRSLRNGAILAVIIALVALYQGETSLTAMLSGLFAWAVMTPALWLSYRLTGRSPTNEKEN